MNNKGKNTIAKALLAHMNKYFCETIQKTRVMNIVPKKDIVANKSQIKNFLRIFLGNRPTTVPLHNIQSVRKN